MPPPLPAARPLGEYGNQVIALAPEISTVGWLPEIKPALADDAHPHAGAIGCRATAFHRTGRRRGHPAPLDRPLYPIIDIAPERNRRVLGVDAGAFPERLAAIRQARDTRKVARTSPLRLVQAPADDALLLYGPVFAKDGPFLGVIGFGYKIEPLFHTALSNPRPIAISAFASTPRTWMRRFLSWLATRVQHRPRRPPTKARPISAAACNSAAGR